MAEARRRGVVALSCALAGLLGACGDTSSSASQHDEDVTSTAAGLASRPAPRWPASIRQLRVGIPPIVGPERTRREYQPLVDHLGARLGVPATLTITADYAELAERVRRQEIDLAVFTALSYVEAKRQDSGLQLLLRQVSEGLDSYIGYVYTREGTGITALADLRGRSMCFVDPLSTSGAMYPRALLSMKGLDPDALFGRVEYTGDHLACVERVLAGELDAGAGYSGVLAIARSKGLEVNALRVLGKTPRIPYNGWAARSGLPAVAAERIRWELLRLSTRSPHGKQVLSQEMQLNAWTLAEDGDYDSVRQALELSRAKAP